LDYHEIGLRGSASSREGGVVIDAPDVCSQIEGLIARGESETREFKREIPRDKNNTFLKTVAAFANGKGGVVLFGVVDETGHLRGIVGNLQEQKDRVVHMIRDNVVPQPNLRVENCKLNGKQIIAVFVDEGDSSPYGLDPAKPRFYIRRGATTFPANQTEIRAFAKKFDGGSQAYSVDPFG
jgi:predicted HTH transcriptional regulator